MNNQLTPVKSEEGYKLLSKILGVRVQPSKPEYELHFAIKAVVWEDGTVSWEHAGEMYESGYKHGTVWDSKKCEWDFYRENNETMESKCHEKLSESLKMMSSVV